MQSSTEPCPASPASPLAQWQQGWPRHHSGTHRQGKFATGAISTAKKVLSMHAAKQKHPLWQQHSSFLALLKKDLGTTAPRRGVGTGEGMRQRQRKSSNISLSQSLPTGGLLWILPPGGLTKCGSSEPEQQRQPLALRFGNATIWQLFGRGRCRPTEGAATAAATGQHCSTPVH